MYYHYFGLNEAPFSIAVNPRYLFMSPRHRDALAHLLYGVGVGGGFILLTGEVGTGKTTINRCLLEQLPPDTDIAIILNPALNAMELLASVCDELGIDYDTDNHTLKVLTDKLHSFLLQNHMRGRRTVLLIDEAQHLDFEVLEQIRLLTNLETNSEKLLQIVLIGQPELAQMLSRPELRQLNQRITARYNLDPLNLEETAAYIQHRLQVAGMSPERQLFPSSVVRGIYKATRGIPRVINVLCDRILLGAYGRNKSRADHAMLKLAVREVMGEDYSESVLLRWLLLAFLVGLLLWGGGWLIGKYSFETAVEPSPVESVLEDFPPRSEMLEEELSSASETTRTPSNDEVVLLSETTPSQIPAAHAAPGVDTSSGPVDISTAMYPPGQATAQLWSLHTDEPVPEVPCLWNEQTGLACIEGEAWTWDDLIEFDRPLALEVITSERFSAEVLLLGIEDSTGWVLTGQGVARVSLGELAPFWTGRYHFFWHPPNGFETSVMLGQKGDVVRTIAEMFARLDGQSEPLAGRYFNKSLQQRVRLFQLEHGLKADGLAGEQTLLKLNEQLGVDITAAQARQQLTSSSPGAFEQ